MTHHLHDAYLYSLQAVALALAAIALAVFLTGIHAPSTFYALFGPPLGVSFAFLVNARTSFSQYRKEAGK